MKKKHERGFSLVELIIMIVIIGILTAVAMTRYQPFSDAAKAAACKQNQMHIETAQSLFYMDRYMEHDGRYATTLAELEPYFPDGHQPKCPSNRPYELSANGVVDCLEPGHHR